MSRLHPLLPLPITFSIEDTASEDSQSIVFALICLDGKIYTPSAVLKNISKLDELISSDVPEKMKNSLVVPFTKAIVKKGLYLINVSGLKILEDYKCDIGKVSREESVSILQFCKFLAVENFVMRDVTHFLFVKLEIDITGVNLYLAEVKRAYIVDHHYCLEHDPERTLAEIGPIERYYEKIKDEFLEVLKARQFDIDKYFLDMKAKRFDLNLILKIKNKIISGWIKTNYGHSEESLLSFVRDNICSKELFDEIKSDADWFRGGTGFVKYFLEYDETDLIQ